MRGVHARASVEPRLQSRAWLFACVARFARRTKRKERLLVVYFQCIWLLCNSRGIGLKSINIRKCYLQHNSNVFANNANFTVKAWLFEESNYVPVNSKTAHALPYPVRAFDFLKDFGQILRYVGSLDGQMSHRLVLQKASNPPPTSNYWKIFPCVKRFIQM